MLPVGRVTFTMTRLITCVLIFSVFGCGRPSSSPTPSTTSKEKGEELTQQSVLVTSPALGFILPPNDNIKGMWGRDVKWWMPTRRDVAAAEEAVLKCLREVLPDVARKEREYVRQYFGRIANGRRVLMCNFIHESLLQQETDELGIRQTLFSLSTTMIYMSHGGDWFLEFEYEMETHECTLR